MFLPGVITDLRRLDLHNNRSGLSFRQPSISLVVVMISEASSLEKKILGVFERKLGDSEDNSCVFFGI